MVDYPSGVEVLEIRPVDILKTFHQKIMICAKSGHTSSNPWKNMISLPSHFTPDPMEKSCGNIIVVCGVHHTITRHKFST